MERFFHADFSGVRLHQGPMARALGALAFTLGEEIHFAPGLYDPATPEGVALLGHELTHVVQQREGRVANPYGHGIAIVQDPVLEAEADRMGQRIVNAMWPSSQVGQAMMGTSAGRGGEQDRRSFEKLEADNRMRNWQIGTDGKFVAHGEKGILRHREKGGIYFGAENHVRQEEMNRINLRKMAHGLDDSEEKAINSFVVAADLIQQELGKTRQVAVNCGHGNSRTAFALIVYLIRHEKFSYKEAADLITEAQRLRRVPFKLDTLGPNGSYNGWVSKDVQKGLDGFICNKEFKPEQFYNITRSGSFVVYNVEPPKRASKRKRVRSAKDSSIRYRPPPKRRRMTKADELTIREGKAFVARFDRLHAKKHGLPKSSTNA